MKLFRFLRPVPLLAVVLGGLASGCDTYHYYDIDVKFMTPVTETQVSVMKLCLIDVSGAASDEVELACPPVHFPDMGTFEYSTFASSGPITFTFNGFFDAPKSSSNQCATNATTLTASDEITQTGMITVSDFNTTNCPLMVSGSSQ
jgi:hypothetical protein